MAVRVVAIGEEMSERKVFGSVFLGGNCPGGNCQEGNYPHGDIVQGGSVRGKLSGEEITSHPGILLTDIKNYKKHESL